MMMTISTIPKQTDVRNLFLSGLICYFLAIIYNFLLTPRSTRTKHCFNITCGLLICYFNFGNDTIHSLLTCLISWNCMKLLGPCLSMVITNSVFCMTYLLFGYYEKHARNIQGFTWTMPQCVLTLSLIAISFDIYDGQQNRLSTIKSGNTCTESHQSVNEDTALERIPTLLELLSKIYFPPTFLIGPQVKFKDYLTFIESKNNLFFDCWKQSILRLLAGFLYLFMYLLGDKYWPVTYLLSAEFKTYGLFSKLSIIAIVNKLNLCKYISGWLISEGACIMYGIALDPISNQNIRCCNVNILHYETTATFRGVIESFNISTNQFVSKYIFKRFKFLGAKIISQTLSLSFLALWHGLALGYYNTFAMELLVMKFETDMAKRVIEYRTKSECFNQLLNRTSIRWIIYIMMRLHVIYTLSYCFVPFVILNYDEWVSVLSEVYFIGHIFYSTAFILIIILDFYLSKHNKQK